MKRYTTTRLQAIYDSIPAAIDRKIDALIADCETPQINVKKPCTSADLTVINGFFGCWLNSRQHDVRRIILTVDNH